MKREVKAVFDRGHQLDPFNVNKSPLKFSAHFYEPNAWVFYCPIQAPRSNKSRKGPVRALFLNLKAYPNAEPDVMYHDPECRAPPASIQYHTRCEPKQRPSSARPSQGGNSWRPDTAAQPRRASEDLQVPSRLKLHRDLRDHGMPCWREGCKFPIFDPFSKASRRSKGYRRPVAPGP